MHAADERNALVEQRRRMAEAHRAAMPSEAEVDRARRRFEGRRRRSGSPLSRVWALGLAQGFVAGLVTLGAASFVGAKVLPRLAELWGPPAVEAHFPRVPRSSIEAARPSPAVTANAAESVAPPSAAFAEPREGAAASPGGVSTVERSRPAPYAGKAPTPTPPEPSAAVLSGGGAPTAALPASEPSSTSVAWTHVAEAMAARDYPRAEAALERLAASGDAATRDAAALSRAELWIARGSGHAVRADVQRLALQGRTPLIRRRAAGLLARLDGAR